MIHVKLKEAMERYRRLSGERHTYESLARAANLSLDTVSSLGSREMYNPSLSTIEKLCVALLTTPEGVLALDPATAAQNEAGVQEAIAGLQAPKRPKKPAKKRVRKKK